MVLLISRLTDSIKKYAEVYSLGVLHTPRHFVADVYGLPEAADNGCYSGWDEHRYRRYFDRLAGRRLLFCTVPDVVGDHVATLELWREWAPIVRACGLPPAFVLQDGLHLDEIPYDDCAAVFVGGSTEFKLGPVARSVVAEAKRRGLWAHMGRVNSIIRMQYASDIGCGSVDGSGFARFEKYLLWGAQWATYAGLQQPLF